MGDVWERDPSSDRLDEAGGAGSTGHLPPNRHTGHLDQFSGRGGEGDGDGSLSTLSSACSDRAWQTGKVFYQGPAPDAQQWPDTVPTWVVGHAGAMGSEESPVPQSADGRGRAHSCPPPPARSHSFLVTRQRGGFACPHDPQDGPDPLDASLRPPAEGRSLGCGQRRRETLAGGLLPPPRLAPSRFHAPGSGPAPVAEKHRPAVGSAGSVSPERVDEALRSNGAPSSFPAALHDHGTVLYRAHPRAQTQCPQTQSPQTQCPQTQCPQTQSPQTQSPQTRSPQTRSPQTRSPQTRSPQTQSPQTQCPQTQSPQTRSPQTQCPQTQSPQTQSPQTQSPQTQCPQTQSPQTRSPQTQSPQTQSPQTQSPQTQSPQTRCPQTQSPQTQCPQTQSPQTQRPQTQCPHPRACGQVSNSTQGPVTSGQRLAQPLPARVTRSPTPAGAWRPSDGSLHLPCPGRTASRPDPDQQQYNAHDPLGGRRGRQRSWSEASARHVSQEPTTRNNAHGCPPNLDPCTSSTHLTITEAARRCSQGSLHHQHTPDHRKGPCTTNTHLTFTEAARRCSQGSLHHQRTPEHHRGPCIPNLDPCTTNTHLTFTEAARRCVQRQTKASGGGVGGLSAPCPEARRAHHLLEDLFRPAADEPGTVGAITAEHTPMLHRLALEATRVVDGSLMRAGGLSGSTRPAQGQTQRGGDQGPWGTLGCKAMMELWRCKSTSQLLDGRSQLDRLTAESPDASASSSKAAYRKQVKLAQGRVLEETSFKRRDLQLSWPKQAKAKLKPTSGGHVQPDPRHHLALGDPSPRTQVLQEEQRVWRPTEPHHQPARVGGRKRPTLWQKKLSYSEPGRLNQVGRLLSPRSWEQAETFKPAGVYRESSVWCLQEARRSSLVSPRRRLFEEVGLQQVQHQALLQYFGSRRWPRPLCDPRLDGDPPQPALPGGARVGSDDHYSSNSPSRGRTAPQRTPPDKPWDRAPSKSSPLPQQNEPAPNVDTESLGQPNHWVNSPSRLSVAKVEVGADWNYRNNRAVGKSRYGRPRGMSLGDLASSFGNWTSWMSRSTDHLHCPGSGGEPTGQDNVVLDPPPLEMPPAEPNRVKLRMGVKWQTSQGAAMFERSPGVCKSHSTSSSEEPTSPSPPSPMERARARACFLSSLPAQGHEVLLESSSAISEDCGTDHGSTSENVPVQSKPSPLQPENIFQSFASLERAANYETGATDWPMSGKNLLSTVDFVQVKPTGYDTEDDIKDGLVVLASPPLCSGGIIEMTLPTSMAKSEIKGDNTNQLPAKDHRGSRQETSRQPPPDRPNSCVHLRRRTKSPEGLRMEKLMKEIIDEDRSLAEILDPSPTTTTIMDLVEGLFQEDTLVLEACHRRGQVYSQTTEAVTKTTNTQEIQVPSLLGSDNRCKAAATMTLMPDISRERRDWPTDVTDKKKELIVTIRWKLRRLHEANAALQEDMKVNDSLGEDIAACVGQACKPNEMQKYKTFIEDLDKVMGLLLCLSTRLVRVESALNKVNESTGMEEKQSLNERHQTLSHRHEGARGLKVHQDHRERVTFRILRNYLSEIQLQHCHHFVQMRKALIIKQKEIEENLRLTEEQLGFLENSL